MRPNTVKHRLRQGEPALGTWLSLGSPLSAEWLAHQGFDWLSVDQGHSATDIGLTQSMLQAISATDVLPLVGVPANDARAINCALDLGAYGVFVPNVDTREDAEMMISAMKYPPAGHRTIGGARRHLYGGADYVQYANDELIAVVMIQTARGVRNIDDILSVPGIDACFIGPNDLCASLGIRPSGEPVDARFEDAIKLVFDACLRHDVVPGIQTQSVERTRCRMSQGWRLIAFSSDGTLMAQAARGAVESIRGSDAGAGAHLTKRCMSR